MPVYEFQCQGCGEVQVLATPPKEFEAQPQPCRYCGGVAFDKLVGSAMAFTEAVQARHGKIDAALAKEDLKNSDCPQCGSTPNLCETED